jgi:hypothetical protein
MATIASREIMSDLELLRKGSFGDRNDVQGHTLFDSIVPPTSAPSDGLVFFNRGQGAALTSTVQKERFETNIPTNGSALPAGQTFLAKKLKLSLVSFLQDGATDLVNVVNAFYQVVKSSYFRFQIVGKSEYEWEAPGTVFFPTVSEVGLPPGTVDAFRVGDYNHPSIIPFVTPIVIGELVTFRLTCYTGSAVAANLTILNALLTILNTQVAYIRAELIGTLVRSK